MNELTDSQLLRVYAENQSESAFAELVHRHLDFVYSAALRMVCDTHLARDVAQNVFLALAKDARRLKNHPVLAGWLHVTTRNIASMTVRTEVRRRQREQKVVAMNELDPAQTEASWKAIAPELDEVLGQLDESDRDALLLRYFEQHSAREIGQKLGISEDAAQKRVSRAVERLRELFTKRNVTIGATGLMVLISANAIQAAPVGMAIGISTFIGTTAITTATHTTMNWLSLKALSALIGLALITGTTVHLLEHREVKRLESEKSDLTVQTENLQNQLQAADAASTALKTQVEQLQAASSDAAILRKQVSTLRSQVAQSQEQNTQPSPVAQDTSEVSATQATPTFLSPEAGLNKCLNNLRQIDAAMQQFALENHLSPTNIVTADDILPYISGGKLPQCPSGGTYTFGSLTNQPTCSIPGHSFASEPPATGVSLAPVMTAIMLDYNRNLPPDDVRQASAAFKQDHPDQALVGINDFIPYLPNPGPRLLAAEQNFVRDHGRMPTNGLELAPYFPSGPQN